MVYEGITYAGLGLGVCLLAYKDLCIHTCYP